MYNCTWLISWTLWCSGDWKKVKLHKENGSTKPCKDARSIGHSGSTLCCSTFSSGSIYLPPSVPLLRRPGASGGPSPPSQHHNGRCGVDLVSSSTRVLWQCWLSFRKSEQLCCLRTSVWGAPSPRCAWKGGCTKTQRVEALVCGVLKGKLGPWQLPGVENQVLQSHHLLSF